MPIKDDSDRRGFIEAGGRMGVLQGEFGKHYHGERNHQGLTNGIIEPEFTSPMEGSVECCERLGGLPCYYYREAV